MSWFKEARTPLVKEARTPLQLIRSNIKRFEALRKKILDIKKILFHTQSNAHRMLIELCEDKLVKAHDVIGTVLHSILNGENNQKEILDNPTKVSKKLDKVILLIDDKIRRDRHELREKTEWDSTNSTIQKN